MCPRCGKRTSFNPDRKGLCLECFLEVHRSRISESRPSVAITVCIGCGRIRHGKEWLIGSPENVKKVLSLLLKKTNLRIYDFDVEISDNFLDSLSDYKKAYVPVNLYVSGEKVVQKHVEVRLDKAFCPICSSKKSGKYYESVIHLRYGGSVIELMDDVSRFMERALRLPKRLEVFDVKKEGRSGLVVRVSDRRLAREFLGFLATKYSLIILKKYREPILVSLGQGTMRQVMVEKYLIRLIRAQEPH